MVARQNGYLVTFTDSYPNGDGNLINAYSIIQNLLRSCFIAWWEISALYSRLPPFSILQVEKLDDSQYDCRHRK
jgi:hypothetical protein